jgi:signal transduction histidine kinase
MKTFLNEITKSFNIYNNQCIINFNCNIKETIICKIDKVTFQNAFNSILNNAMKYNFKDTEIDVTLSAENNSDCVIIVRNLGIGILKEEIDKVFDVFFRGSNIGNTPGLGTGLPMAKELIKFNNGDIRIESYVNKYVNVIITLPLLIEDDLEHEDK